MSIQNTTNNITVRDYQGPMSTVQKAEAKVVEFLARSVKDIGNSDSNSKILQTIKKVFTGYITAHNTVVDSQNRILDKITDLKAHQAKVLQSNTKIGNFSEEGMANINTTIEAKGWGGILKLFTKSLREELNDVKQETESLQKQQNTALDKTGKTLSKNPLNFDVMGKHWGTASLEQKLTLAKEDLIEDDIKTLRKALTTSVEGSSQYRQISTQIQELKGVQGELLSLQGNTAEIVLKQNRLVDIEKSYKKVTSPEEEKHNNALDAEKTKLQKEINNLASTPMTTYFSARENVQRVLSGGKGDLQEAKTTFREAWGQASNKIQNSSHIGRDLKINLEGEMKGIDKQIRQTECNRAFKEGPKEGFSTQYCYQNPTSKFSKHMFQFAANEKSTENIDFLLDAKKGEQLFVQGASKDKIQAHYKNMIDTYFNSENKRGINFGPSEKNSLLTILKDKIFENDKEITAQDIMDANNQINEMTSKNVYDTFSRFIFTERGDSLMKEMNWKPPGG